MKDLKYGGTQREEAPPVADLTDSKSMDPRSVAQEWGQLFSTRRGSEWKSTTSLSTLGRLADIFLHSKTVFLEEEVHRCPAGTSSLIHHGQES